MDFADLTELHCIMPIANMALVVEHGILSHERAAELPHASAAMPEIQERRAQVRVPGGLRLHDYVNLYFTARNPMMYLRQQEHAGLCIVSVIREVLMTPGAIVTDRNAAADYVRFEPAPDGLAIVDQEMTFARYWTDPDFFAQIRRKQAKQAEVLIPDRVPPESIRGAYVSCEAGRQALAAETSECKVKLEADLFFR